MKELELVSCEAELFPRGHGLYIVSHTISYNHTASATSFTRSLALADMQFE